MSLRYLSRSWSGWLFGLMLSLFVSSAVLAADDFLPVEEAFKIEAVASADGQVQLNFTIAPKTHLYRDRLIFAGLPDTVSVGAPVMPDGKRQYDATFEKEVEVYYEGLAITLPVQADAGVAFLKLGYQGCADEGLCYPPQTRFFKLTLAEAGKIASVEPATSEEAEKAATAGASAPVAASAAAPNPAPQPASASQASGSSIENALASGSLLKIVGVFFVAGLLLSFTPCVLPMVPILSSIIVGEGQNVSRLRGFMLALSYSQGMSLVYISQTRDVVLGGSALYALAWGMSVPLLLVGVSAGSLLPRTGMWMESVKTVFGMLMLGVAWWLVSPVLPDWALLGTAGLWLMLGGSFMGAFDSIGPQASVLHRALKAFGFAFVVLGVFQLYGAVTGASSPWDPLGRALSKTVVTAQAAVPGVASASSTADALPFKKVRTPEELDAALAEAKTQGKVALVDFYADWCVACKEMEHLTFTDTQVKAWMAQSVLIQADVTDVTDGTKALLKRFGLFGPPGIIFFDAVGNEVKDARVIGFQKPEEFILSLQKVRP